MVLPAAFLIQVCHGNIMKIDLNIEKVKIGY
jgi:hypothetical protein